MKRGKVKIDASCSEPQGGQNMQGDGTQESDSRAELAVLFNPTADAPSLLIDAHENEEENGATEFQSEELKLLPKHRIFLSHSGAQKPFVEQLCVDLENAGHFPFFDRRPESLPKGEGFADLILQAARQCHVAVVVLSMKYLESKWPMLELIAFVEARGSLNLNLKILPLFYKIGVVDLKNKRDHLMSVWRKHAEKDSRFHPEKCDSALRFLAGINGEVFVGESEVAYRRAIVASVCKLCLPDVQFDVSAMQGRDRLCDRRKHYGASIVGVHGMGGTGKTLLCKALCNFYNAEFAGRVLHLELKGYKDSSKQENIIDAQKLLLEALTNASTNLLRTVASVEQGNSLMHHLERRDVFMAVDNVPEGNTDWLQKILCSLSPSSKAIVTSRSLDNLKNVLERKSINIVREDWFRGIPHEKISYIQVPTLDKDEALKIFQQHALVPTRLLSPFTVEEMKVLETCIKLCFFPDQDQPAVESDSRHVSGHYHPLSLKALGSYLKGIDPQEPLQWIQKSKVLHERRLFYKDSVFEILRTGYDALPSQQDRLLFLDIAVFAPRGKLNNLQNLCNWLGAIHGMGQEMTLYKMKNLQRNSLIENWEKNKTLKVTVHDLYLEFAEHQIKLEESQRIWCVYESGGRTLPMCLMSHPEGLRWPSLVRLRLQTATVITFPHEKLREWANLVVLDINLVQHKSLDISPLKCLRGLKLKSFILETLTLSDNMEDLRFVKLSCARLVQEPDFSTSSNLLELNVRLANATVCAHQKVDPLQPYLCTVVDTLKVLRLTCWIPEFPEFLVLGNLPNLEVVEIVNDLGFSRHEESFVVASLGVFTRLRRLVLKNLPIRGSLPGLENLVSLEDLVLNRCRSLNDLPGLGGLTNLQVLDVSSTAISKLSGLEKLLQLRGLYLVNCIAFKSLPDLQSLPNLKEVFTMGCNLTWQPKVSKSCTLISDSSREVLVHLWARFLESFYYWTHQKSVPDSNIDFQKMLSLCPTVERYELVFSADHGELKELSESFQDAFRMMHSMAGAGRTKQEFDPETDLIICSKIVCIIPKYANHPDIRMLLKGGNMFLDIARRLRDLVKTYQTCPGYVLSNRRAALGYWT